MTEVFIESLDREGRGVAHVNGKAIFIEGALPAERVSYSVLRRRPSYEIARADRILEPSGSRVTAQCEHFGVCGGCSLQHLEMRAQVAAKQRVLEDAFRHLGNVEPGRLLAPVYGNAWEYRHRARFTVRRVAKKGGVLVGFHERGSSYVVDMRNCHVLPRAIAEQIPALRVLVEKLSIRERLPQIEIAVGERVTVLVFRILEGLTPDDEFELKGYAEQSGMQVWLQPKGPETARPFWPEGGPELDYGLPEFDLRLRFLPTDFTQVNHAANRILVRRAMRLLDPRSGDRIADFFCGLGNFTLPIARLGAQVVGVEGSKGLIGRARENALANGLEAVARFESANLFEATQCASYSGYDKALIDPPRDGAMELVKSFASGGPRRIVYVSCDPATLARDAGVLVHALGYSLEAAGIVNMFPHTSHVESIALFERL